MGRDGRLWIAVVGIERRELAVGAMQRWQRRQLVLGGAIWLLT